MGGSVCTISGWEGAVHYGANSSGSESNLSPTDILLLGKRGNGGHILIHIFSGRHVKLYI